MIAKTIKWVLGLAALVVVLLFPYLFGIYLTNIFVTFAIYALFAVTLNMLLGFAGLLSFGHAMYFGIGAYGTALALTHINGLSLLPSIVIGFFSALLLAAIICPIVVRTSGAAFAMLHLAFGQIMYVLVLKLRHITGGEDGVGGFPLPPLNIPGLGSIDITDSTNFFYFSIVVLGLSMYFLWFFLKTPLGCVTISLRDNTDRVASMGFKVPQTKAVVYLLSCSFAGIAGSIYALFQNLVAADGTLDILTSFAPVIMTMIGGSGNFFGPILGSALYQVIEELGRNYTDQLELILGVILILVMLYVPMGIMGVVQTLREKRQQSSAGWKAQGEAA